MLCAHTHVCLVRGWHRVWGILASEMWDAMAMVEALNVDLLI